MAMTFLKKYRYEILLSLLFCSIYFFTRIFHILTLPIFTDEAIYVRWAQIAKQDAAWRFISLTDGKQPLFVWIAMILMRIFHDPLLAGRFVSVIAGALTTIGLYFLSLTLFKNRWIAFLASGIYILFPFGLVYDRMALYDSLVATSIIWGIYIEVLLAKKVRLDVALIAALIVGAGMLNKTTAFFNLYFLPFTLFVFDWKQKFVKKKLIEWGIYALVTVILANLYYAVLRLSPYFGIINEKNHTFYYSFHDWIQHPLTFFLGNLQGMLNIVLTYYGFIGLLVTLYAFVVMKKFWKEKVLLLAWVIPPFLVFAMIAKIVYPRYLLPMIVPLLPIMAVGLYSLLTKWRVVIFQIIILLIFSISYLRVDYLILTDFAHAPLPGPDLAQYINSWPAGGGVKESIGFFRKKALTQHIYIATQGTFGLMPFSLEMYLVDNPNVTLKGYWPIDTTLPKEVVKASQTMPTYFVFYQPCINCTNRQEAPRDWHVKEIAKYRQGIGTDYLYLYQVLPMK